MSNSGPEDTDSPDISEILETIRQVASEEEPGVITSGLPDAAGEFTEAAQYIDDVLSPAGAQDVPSPDTDAQPHQTSLSSDTVPRRMGDLRDTRMSQLAAHAWPGVGSDILDLGRMDRTCFGPVISNTTDVAAKTRRSDEQPNSDRRDAGSEAEKEPRDNPRNWPIAAPNIAGDIEDMPELQGRSAKGSSDAPEPSKGGTIDEATAQLLRPLIVQWVNENMPRIVERALSVDDPGSKH